MRTSEQAQRRKLILEIVENQIREGNPPETKATLERLLEAGIPMDNAMDMIGAVVVSEIFDVLKQGRNFDLERYIEMLNALPKLPFDEDE
jgi:hypothetical protein